MYPNLRSDFCKRDQGLVDAFDYVYAYPSGQLSSLQFRS